MDFNKNDIISLFTLLIFILVGILFILTNIFKTIGISVIFIGLIIYFIIGVVRKRIWVRFGIVEGTMAIILSVVFITIFVILYFIYLYFMI